MKEINRTVVWRTPHLPGTLFLHGDFRRLHLEAHFHDEFAIGITESGHQCFSYGNRQRLDRPSGSVALIAPGVVHRGWSGVEGGWRYRMVYLPESLVRSAVLDIFEAAALRTFAKPVVDDAVLFGLIARFHRMAGTSAPEPLGMQSLCLAIVEHAYVHHANQEAPRAVRIEETAPRLIRDLIETRYRDSLTLEELSAAAGMSKFRLLRQFQSAYGLPPHAYLRLTRVKRARDAILAGAKLTEVAAAVGFSDQAHMTRTFRRTLGYTPGNLVRAIDRNPRTQFMQLPQ